MNKFLSSGLIDEEIYIEESSFEDREICLRCSFIKRVHSDSVGDPCVLEVVAPSMDWFSSLSLDDFANLFFRHYQTKMGCI